MSESQPRPVGQILGAGHGAALFAAIGTLVGGSVGVDGDEGVGGESRSRAGHVESTGQVGSQMGVRLKMGRQGGQRRLGMRSSAATTTDGRQIKGHGGQDARDRLPRRAGDA